MKHYHIFKVSYVGCTNTKPARTKVYSERFKQGIFLSNNDERFDNIDTIEHRAIFHLQSLGFDIKGFGEGKGCMYIFSSTFKPIKEKK